MLRVNQAALTEALYVTCMMECENLTEWLWQQIHSKAPPEVKREMMQKEIITEGKRIMCEISAAGIGALTTEWGSGSLADESNPAWNDYTHSKYYNPSRHPYGHPISGRPAGDYINLDDEIKHSTGMKEQINLESSLKPREPQHWMREIVELSRPYILESLSRMIVEFPFHRFIED